MATSPIFGATVAKDLPPVGIAEGIVGKAEADETAKDSDDKNLEALGQNTANTCHLVSLILGDEMRNRLVRILAFMSKPIWK